MPNGARRYTPKSCCAKANRSQAEDLIALTKSKLGGYKAPKTLVFVDALPTSVVGKVLRREVKEKYWANSGRKVG